MRAYDGEGRVAASQPFLDMGVRSKGQGARSMTWEAEYRASQLDETPI